MNNIYKYRFLFAGHGPREPVSESRVPDRHDICIRIRGPDDWNFSASDHAPSEVDPCMAWLRHSGFRSSYVMVCLKVRQGVAVYEGRDSLHSSGRMGFKEKVWEACRQVPEHKVTTYKLIAEFLGTKAYRAVGTALNKNPHVEVPCHRVVNSDGSAGGFARGTRNKVAMLRKEGIEIKNGKIVDFEKRLYHY